jgi:uncharacterized DUF497 family protein
VLRVQDSTSTRRPGNSSSKVATGQKWQVHKRRRLAKKLHCSYAAPAPDLSFEWDDRKNRANQRKHGVSFEEAQTVFYDERALLIADPDSEDEERFLLLGLSATLRTLVVCHCCREQDEVIRIISAWKATRSERRQYDER